jgi:hypothetical protein
VIGLRRHALAAMVHGLAMLRTKGVPNQARTSMPSRTPATASQAFLVLRRLQNVHNLSASYRWLLLAEFADAMETTLQGITDASGICLPDPVLVAPQRRAETDGVQSSNRR